MVNHCLHKTILSNDNVSALFLNVFYYFYVLIYYNIYKVLLVVMLFIICILKKYSQYIDRIHFIRNLF